MTTLTHIWQQPLAHAMGWTLLHFCWQGALIAILLWCALGLLSGGSPKLRYLAACFALGLTVLVPLATFAHIASTQHDMRAANSAIVVDGGMVLRIGANGISGSWQERFAETLDRALPWLMLTWSAGVLFFLGRLHAGFFIARRMRMIAVQPASADLQVLFDELCHRLELSRPVRLMKSALVQVPTVIGWLQPIVLVPVSCFMGLSTQQIEAILSHELAHVRRHDYLVSVFQSVIEALLFYHPAVWWVSKQVRRERECCCDDLAVAVGGDALAYAKALSYLEERRARLPELALGANGGVLTMRIKRLLGYTERSAASQLAAMMVLTVVVAAMAASVGTMARAEAGTASHLAPATVPVALETPAALDMQIAVPRLPEPLAAPTARAASFTFAAAEPPAPVPPPEPQGPTPGEALKVPSGMMQGNLIYRPDPIYPEIAKAAHVQGAVVLRAIISKAGTMEKLQAISGPTMLQGSAMDAVRQWLYKPYVVNGEPVEVETTITVNYTFGESAETQGQASPDNASAAQKRIGANFVAPIKVNYALEPPPASEPPTAELNPGGVPKRIGGSVTAPTLLTFVDPEYSEAARAAKFSGVVLVNLWVDPSGNPTHVRVVRGVGMGLDEKAIEAVQRYKFKPAMENGKPVLVELNIEINFKIGDPAKAQGQPIDRSHMSSVPKKTADNSVA